MINWQDRQQTNKPNWYIIEFMKKLMSSRPSGLAIIEVILVMTISALLFGVVIGTFATRRKAASDDAARQVMSEIAKVRNQAQQGQGASTVTIPTGNELFGQAIKFDGKKMTVHKLMQDRTTLNISSYESYDIKMPNSLKWYIVPGYFSESFCDSFTSCYGSSIAGLPYLYLGSGPILLDDVTKKMLLVFRNNTGQSYAFAVPATTNDIGGASVITNYTTDRQQKLRLAFYYTQLAYNFIPRAFAGGGGFGGTPPPPPPAVDDTEVSPNKYYANFDLAIPNNQDLQVVK